MDIDVSPSIDLTGFAQIVGQEHVRTSGQDRAFYSQDIWTEGAPCAVVVSPRDQAEAAACVALAAQRKLSINVRGGGMSYTGGYVPLEEGTVTLDLSRLNRIIAVDAENMAVTVECGVTWADLDAALAPLGLRTPFWGPFSGRVSTVGGALSQNAVFFGSGLYGAAADSVIGLTVALATGAVVRTGAGAGQTGPAFFRHYGPDLTGLFTGDAGAFGVKLAAVLRLIPRPAHLAFASFDVDVRAALLHFMHAVGREQLASECFAFDPFLQSMRLRRESLSKDFAALKNVLKAEGVGAGVRMALAGRRSVETLGFAVHVVCEDRSKAGVDDRIARVGALAVEAGARAIEPTMPRVARAMPFGPLNGMLGADGERWVPVHGVVAHSQCAPLMADFDRFMAGHAAEMARREVTSGHMFCTIQAGATLFEPVFYWPDARTRLHERSVAPDFLAGLKTYPVNETTRAFVDRLRTGVIDIFARHGAVHFQVGKTYPCQDTRSAGAANLLADLKGLLDPHARLNPGARTAKAAPSSASTALREAV